MTMTDLNPFLVGFIAQNEYLGMVGLGKLADPTAGGAVVDLAKTKLAIDMLQMLEEKTRGNLTDGEDRELRRVLTFLRLNYVDESGRTPPSMQATPPAEGVQNGEGESARQAGSEAGRSGIEDA